ncbi:C2H2 type zinc finger domain protein [Colletotrichum plurivorum]|uniref:C2H2 type zinc finger domain protein n=1 Tax=Colletotrichum plurivorum TaxID=2175906 RepID=A0A8H6K843_9PEZI|nr:C2H2 type zinc finger domain protein [Colletotrichum plurivorum]
MPFTCDHEGCGRSYLRKEHLTRHKKEHAPTPSFSCPSCGTKFTRGDTLRRHMVLHGPTAPPTRVAQACVPCHRTKTRCDGQQPICSTCNDKGRPCDWPQPRGKNQYQQDQQKQHQQQQQQHQYYYQHDQREDRSPSAGYPIPLCAAPPHPAILLGPMTTGMQPTGLLTQTVMPPAATPMMTASLGGPVAVATAADEFEFPPGSLLNEGMRMQLQRVYFDQFHPQWPLLHRETFQSTPQPKLLMQAVVTVGLWFTSAPGARDLAVKFHDHLLIDVGNRILELLEQSRQGTLSPILDLLPIFQAMLISTILVPYRADKSMENVMMTHSMLLETFKASGLYEQAKINAASHLCGGNGYPWVFRECYQRLAVFQFKLHLILQAIFLTIHPALRISRNAEPAMLKVKVPLPLIMWDGPAVQWFGMMPTDPALHGDDDADDDVLVISRMCDKAASMMDNKPLLPLLSWDRSLGMAIWCWCMKHAQSDREFIENIKPFVLDPLKGTGFDYGSS